MFFESKEISPTKDLSEFILQFNISGAFNEHSDRTTHFLIEKISEFIDIILTFSNEKLQINAVLLASNPQSNLIKAMIKNGMLYSKVTQLINTHIEIPSFVIARICALFTGILHTIPNNCHEIAPYLLNFLPYVDNHAILSLYQNIFEKDHLCTPIIKMIQPLDVPSILFASLNNREDNIPFMSAIFQVANVMCNDEIIQSKFKNKLVIRKVLEYLDASSNEVLYHIYNLILTILDNNTKMQVMPALRKAFLIYREMFQTLDQSKVIMMDFITKMQTYGVTFYDVEENQFFEIILRLFAQFPNNTPLMLSISRYIQECLKDKKLFPSIIENILQAVIDFASYEEHNALHIISMLLLSNIKQLYGNSKEFKDLVNQSTSNYYFFHKTQPEYMTMLKKPYGGKIKKVSKVFNEEEPLY